MRALTTTLIVAASFTAACAHVDVHRVSAQDRDNPSLKGVRYYEPWPYLLVTQQDTDKGPVYSSSIVYLPCRAREFVADVRPGWGTAEGTVELKDGWMLSSLGSKLDSKGPETITAVTGLLGALTGGTKAAAGPQLAPGLYRIEFDENGFASSLTLVKG